MHVQSAFDRRLFAEMLAGAGREYRLHPFVLVEKGGHMKSVTVAAVIASLLLLAAGPSMHSLPPREVERHYLLR